MLVKFATQNFKNFDKELVLNLENVNNYEFNAEAVNQNVVEKCLVYGINGSGKSNLGLAMFDIIFHLTDKEKDLAKYEPYHCLENKENEVCFSYRFKFYDKYLDYSYSKSDCETLIDEKILIDGVEVLKYDYIKAEGYTNLAGTENLQTDLKNNKISFVKYVSKNSVLKDNVENKVFLDFMEYVNHMLLFYSLTERYYQGFRSGSESISKGIIEADKLKEFEKFLADAGINATLVKKEIDGKPQIYSKFKGGETNFFKIASAGTEALTLFYYWYIQMSQASLVFIDEFDAFYHFELAETIVKKLVNLKGVQVILTTHNTDLMSNDLLRPDCYFQLEEGKIKSLAESTHKELRKAHNLQKMYKAGAFDE